MGDGKIGGVQNILDIHLRFDAVGKLVAEDARLQREWPYLVIVPGWRNFFGLFKISDYEIAGAKVGDADFSASWRLNGEYTTEEVA